MPNPVNFAAATQTVTEDDIAGFIPCGPSVENIAEGAKQFVDASFERVALVQIGDTQKEFCELYESELGDALKEL